jgi:hypothetical protein
MNTVILEGSQSYEVIDMPERIRDVERCREINSRKPRNEFTKQTTLCDVNGS